MSRRPWTLALAGCLATGIATGQIRPIPSHPRDLQFESGDVDLPTVGDRRVQSAHGAVIYLAENHTFPLVEITLALRAGAFLEPLEMTGLAFLTASQMRRGGTTRLNADTFDERLESLGAKLDTMSGTTRSGTSLSVPSWALAEALDLLFEMLRRPGFQQDRLTVSRDNLVESLGRRNQDALEILEREWEWLMNGEDHFSTRPMTPATLERIDRGEMAAFHRSYWTPEQMILAVSGDFERQSLLAELERRFAEWPRSDLQAEPPLWPPPPPGPGTRILRSRIRRFR